MTTVILNKINEVRNEVKKQRKQGKTIALVPTMGALHAGHASLIKKAKEMADFVVVSVFVNPIQFGPNEDYDKYPRTLNADAELCENLQADIIFAPSPDEMYGGQKKLTDAELTYVCPPYNYVDCMCGKSRPGHFDGAATVVVKLLNIVAPDYAMFGQKDAQQLFIIKKVVKDLNIDTEIIACPIVREPDGLALSSRNTYLSPEQRKTALSLFKALTEIKNTYIKGITDSKILFDAALAVMDKNAELEYLEFRDLNTFEKKETITPGTLAAVAARVGNTRLIDNIIL